MPDKACSVCKERKNVECFYIVQKRGLLRPHSKCKDCCRKIGRNRDKTSTRESGKWGKIRRQYGLSKDAYLTMLAEQDGRCRICRTSMKPPHVDHCHETGRVRALLCTRCNLGIGNFMHDTTVIRNAIRYLESHA